MSERVKDLYKFGPFLLDSTERLLLRGNDPIPLTPKAFETLLALVENNGHLLDKEQLMRRVWPDSFVEEANLTQNISILRKALGETRDGVQYIETVPRRGYRFVAAVDREAGTLTEIIIKERTRSQIVIEQTAGPNTSSVEQGPATTKPTGLQAIKTGTVVWVLSILLVGLILAGGYWRFFKAGQKRMGPALLSSLSLTPVASWKNEMGQFSDGGSFSRDGKKIAFSMSRGGYQNIWIKQIIGDDPIQITQGNWNDWTPIWSPDDDRIALFSDRGGQTAIWVLPSLGGTPRRFVTVDSGGITPFLRLWSRDGQRLYFELRSNLYLYDLESQNITRITSFDPAGYYRHFGVSQDERHFAYRANKDGQVDIWVEPMSGGAPLQVTSDKNTESLIVWHPDGNRIIYSADYDGTSQLFAAYLDGSEPIRLTFGSDDRNVTDVSSDGKAVCEVTFEQESNLWGVNIDEGREYEVSSGEMLIWPEASPDGKVVAFQITSARNKLLESSIFLRPTGNGRQTRVTDNGFDISWSPDGGRIAFLRRHASKIDIWSVKSTGDDEKQITSGGVKFGGYNSFPCERLETRSYSWSPDGSRIAYCSSKDGAQNIWVVSADGSADNQVSDNTNQALSLLCPLWSPDGSRVAYASEVKPEARGGAKPWRIWVIEDGRSRVVFESDSVIRLIDWFGTSNRLLVARQNADASDPAQPAGVDLIGVPVGSESPQTLKKLQTPYFSSIRLSPDGRAAAFVSEVNGRNVIELFATTDGDVRRVVGTSEPKFYFSSLVWSPDGRTIYYTKQTSRSLLNVINNFE
jgi:Tol biopolymer transport system component/DNA-binding winged helix-turn-helix (wHTH) protein